MAQALGISPAEVRAWKGRGCVECNQKGHRGRVAVYEFFLVEPGHRRPHPARACAPAPLREAARKLGWRSLREMGWLKVQKGLIPISEQERWTRLLDPAALLQNPDAG